MYKIEKRVEISGSHCLHLPYESKCTKIHGHNWIINIYCKTEKLNESGMVVDFTEIKEKIKDRLDHKHLNDVLPFNPTAENIAKWVCDNISLCYKVKVQESEGNIAVYEITN